MNIASKTYFSSEKYPSNGGFVGQGFTDLKKALQLAATKCGYNITSNGGGKSLRTFTCKHTRKYRNNIKSRQDLQYRKRSFHNDKRNTRGYEGRHLPRLSNTYRSSNLNDTCRYYFNVKYNESGFYIQHGHGCTHHCNHVKIGNGLDIVPPRLLSLAEKQLTQSVLNADAGLGTARNVYLERTNIVLSRQNIKYLRNLDKNMKRVPELEHLSSADKLIEFLQKRMQNMHVYIKNYQPMITILH